MKRSPALRAILTAWLVVGVLDISSAIVIWYQRGTGLRRGLQGIAAGILGPKSLEGGIATAFLGLAIHFFIAFVVVSIFYLASRKTGFLLKQPLVSGALYGILVYLFMYWVVLPTVFPKFRHRIGNDALAIAIHISLIGLPTAFIISRYSQPNE
ncbi:MAG TPA: hypothetical protein VFP82_00320 [Chthoniobacterales bacterium]|nr:hypothetical protein [Chthoniobacterales bacterium]